MSEIQAKTVAAGDCTVHVLETGDVGAAAVILLHGMKFNATTWRDLGTLQVLADMGLHVLALDMPGFGASPVCEKSSPEAVLSAFFHSQKLEKAALIGPSMGGRIAMEFAIKHPSMVSALVLAGPVGVTENKGQFDRISAPTLAVWGEADQVSPPNLSEVLAEEVPNLRLEIYPQAPHPCYLEQPERWHGHLKEFLAEHLG